MSQEYDKGFRSILSNSTVFAALLKSFIKAPWTEMINPESLEMVNTSFILSTFEKREADIIYKLHNRQYPDQAIYFYCLMELQSTVDYSMPIRLFIYMASLWMYLLKTVPAEILSRSDFRLPPIIPVVLYNGKDPWTVPREFASIYQGDSSIFKDYAVNFKYQVIDVNRYTWEELLDIGNLMAAVFFVDQKEAPVGSSEYLQELPKKLEAALPILKKLSIPEGNIFLHWMKGIVLERIPKTATELRKTIKEILATIEKETDVYMFVSNFAEDYGNAMKQLDADLRELRRLKTAERKWARAEREKTRAEQEKTRAEQEKTRAEQALRQALRGMKELGIPVQVIAEKTGLQEEEIEHI